MSEPTELKTGTVTIVWRGWNQRTHEEWRATRAGIPDVQGYGQNEKSALRALIDLEDGRPARLSPFRWLWGGHAR
jgi:hypothetical protein